jgi:hypothetical protein
MRVKIEEDVLNDALDTIRGATDCVNHLKAENKKLKEVLQLIVKSFPREVLSDQIGEEWNDIEELINNLP